MIWLRAIVLMAVVGAMCCEVRGQGELHERLPADALGFVEVDPGAVGRVKAEGGKENSLLDLGMEAMQSFGVLPKGAEVVTDSLGLAAVAGEHRSCVAVLDAELETKPLLTSSTTTGRKSLACKSVQVAWVIEMQPTEARGMVERITRLLDHCSTQTTARQAVKKAAETQKEYVEFWDTTWPAWVKLAWAEQGGTFVLTLGEGAMEHFLAGRPVGGAPWLPTVAAADAEAVRQKEAAADGNVLMRMYVGAKAVRERFPEAVKRTVLGQVMGSLDLENADRGLLTARAKGRVISLDSATVTGGKMVLEPWTMNVPADSPLMKLVPAEATAYLAIKMDWRKAYDRVLAIVDASVKREWDDPMEKAVDDFAGKQGVDVRKDILAKLSPVVVVHDAPQHPLRLPLMVTMEGGAEAGAAKALEKVVKSAAAMLDAQAGGKKGGDLMRFRLRTDKDGVTYMQVGLVGPAWTWEGNRWIISWSPAAVRYNLPMLRAVKAEAFLDPQH